MIYLERDPEADPASDGWTISGEIWIHTAQMTKWRETGRCGQRWWQRSTHASVQDSRWEETSVVLLIKTSLSFDYLMQFRPVFLFVLLTKTNRHELQVEHVFAHCWNRNIRWSNNLHMVCQQDEIATVVPNRFLMNYIVYTLLKQEYL